MFDKRFSSDLDRGLPGATWVRCAVLHRRPCKLASPPLCIAHPIALSTHVKRKRQRKRKSNRSRSESGCSRLCGSARPLAVCCDVPPALCCGPRPASSWIRRFSLRRGCSSAVHLALAAALPVALSFTCSQHQVVTCPPHGGPHSASHGRCTSRGSFRAAMAQRPMDAQGPAFTCGVGRVPPGTRGTRCGRSSGRIRCRFFCIWPGRAPRGLAVACRICPHALLPAPVDV